MYTLQDRKRVNFRKFSSFFKTADWQIKVIFRRNFFTVMFMMDYKQEDWRPQWEERE